MDTKALEEEHERLKDELAAVEAELEKALIELLIARNKNETYDIRSVICEQPIMDPVDGALKYNVNWKITPPPPIVVTMEFDTEILFKDTK